MKQKRQKKNAAILAFLVTLTGVSAVNFSSPAFASAVGAAQDAAQPAVTRRIGSIKAVSGNSITLTPDSGPAIAVTVQPSARLLRIAPGEKDLKTATPIQLSDLQVGDRVRVRGTASADGASIAALEIIVIPAAVVAAVSEQMRQDWQKRGLGGPVTAVDPAAGTVTISTSGFAGKNPSLCTPPRARSFIATPPIRRSPKMPSRSPCRTSTSTTNCARAETATPTAAK